MVIRLDDIQQILDERVEDLRAQDKHHRKEHDCGFTQRKSKDNQQNDQAERDCGLDPEIMFFLPYEANAPQRMRETFEKTGGHEGSIGRWDEWGKNIIREFYLTSGLPSPPTPPPRGRGEKGKELSCLLPAKHGSLHRAGMGRCTGA